MDRSGYYAPSRGDQPARHGIAFPHVQPRAALRGPRSIREPETTRIGLNASAQGARTDRYGSWLAMITIALGIGLILARLRAARDEYVHPGIAWSGHRPPL